MKYTLIADGSSDACLIHIINWVLMQHPAVANIGIIEQFADLRVLAKPVGQKLHDRLRIVAERFPCDLLFIHRDAERESLANRRAEIEATVESMHLPAHVPIVPVRMTEAWLLIDQAAIRKAADNPNGTVPLPFPRLHRLESDPNPKATLDTCLLEASETSGRRQAQLKRTLPRRRARVAQLLDDYAPLRALPAFRQFENDTRHVLESWSTL